MRSLSLICFTALAASVLAQDSTSVATATNTGSVVSSASASAAAASSTGAASSGSGKVFQRFMQIWLENTDYETAASLPVFQGIAAQGILLNNTYAVTHPSEPNYVAAAGGSNFGIDNDDFYNIPANISTIYDLLEAKGLGWKAYQEDMPSVGYTAYTAHNGSYVRKHNPAIIFDSIGLNATRSANVVPATQLASDIAAGLVPEWVFYTPNMTNDGHDSTAQVAGNWLAGFLNTTLSNQTFLQETLVLITFDENETYAKANRVWTLLMGAIPAANKGTTDTTFYTHFSSLSTVEQNWDLGNLGRGDANKTLANVYDFVAKQINYQNVNIANGSSVSDFNETITGLMTNQSYNETHAPAPTTSGSAAVTSSALLVTVAGAVLAALML